MQQWPTQFTWASTWNNTTSTASTSISHDRPPLTNQITPWFRIVLKKTIAIPHFVEYEGSPLCAKKGSKWSLNRLNQIGPHPYPIHLKYILIASFHLSLVFHRVCSFLVLKMKWMQRFCSIHNCATFADHLTHHYLITMIMWGEE
jgi:hypothetical protein